MTLITLSPPTIGQVVWGGPLNTLLQALIDAANASVTPDDIDLSDGDLDFRGNSGIDLGTIGFVPGAAPASGPAFYVSTTGELHYVDAVGNDVQLTLEGQIDLTVNGGIGGDYVAAGAHLNYVASSNSYTHTDGNGNASLIDGGGLVMRSGASSGYVKFLAPSNIGTSNYALTWPSGLTGSLTAGPVYVDATGTVTFNPERMVTEWLDISAGIASAGSPTYGGATGWLLGSANNAVDVPIPVRAGETIQSIEAQTAGGIVTNCSLWFRGAGGYAVPVAQHQFSVTADCVINSSNVTGTMPYVPASTGSLFFKIVAVGSADSLYTLNVVKRIKNP